MEIEFRRTGERRYAIRISRAGHPTIEMDPAPGYDPQMPHDLAHLIVEREIGLRGGVFGQIAAGGNAGTFRPVLAPGSPAREAARLRRKVSKRGESLQHRQSDEAMLVERLVDACLGEWASRMTSRRERFVIDDSLQKILTGARLDQICSELDRISRLWIALGQSESLTLAWPPEALAHRAARRSPARQ